MVNHDCILVACGQSSPCGGFLKLFCEASVTPGVVCSAGAVHGTQLPVKGYIKSYIHNKMKL